MSEGQSSNIEFLHEIKQSTIKDGKRVKHEEFIILGAKGLTIRFFHQEGDETVKHHITRNEDGTFTLKTTLNKEQVPAETLSKADLLKKIGKDKLMAFAVNFLKAMKGGNIPVKTGGVWMARAKKASRKGSRRGSRRRSKRSKKSKSKSKGSRRRRGSRRSKRSKKSKSSRRRKSKRSKRSKSKKSKTSRRRRGSRRH